MTLLHQIYFGKPQLFFKFSLSSKNLLTFFLGLNLSSKMFALVNLRTFQLSLSLNDPNAITGNLY